MVSTNFWAAIETHPGKAIQEVRVEADGTFRSVFEFILDVEDMADRVTKKFASGGIRAANFNHMMDIANEKDKRKEGSHARAGPICHPYRRGQR